MCRIFLFLMASSLCITALAQGQGASAPRVPSVTVTGEGEIRVAPDLVTITFGVVTEAESAAKALEQNRDKMNAVFEALNKAGIADADIQTSNVSVMPKFEHDPSGKHPPRLSGYQVTNEVRVRVHKLDRVGTLVDSVVSAGANQIHGIEFSVQNRSQALDAARRKAVDDAMRKAKLYADAAGVQLGQVRRIREQQQSQPVPLRSYALSAAAESTPVAAGQQQLQVTVEVTVAIRPEKKKGSR